MFNGSNPHSKGDLFSRSLIERVDKIMVIALKARAIKIIIIKVIDFNSMIQWFLRYSNKQI